MFTFENGKKYRVIKNGLPQCADIITGELYEAHNVEGGNFGLRGHEKSFFFFHSKSKKDPDNDPANFFEPVEKERDTTGWQHVDYMSPTKPDLSVPTQPPRFSIAELAAIAQKEMCAEDLIKLREAGLI